MNVMNVLYHQHNVIGGVPRDRFSDLQLITECGQKVAVHKVVVASVSSMISSMLSKKDMSEIAIRNVKFSALEHIVNFIYDRKIMLSNKGEVEDFADAYRKLKLNLGPKINQIIQKIEVGTINSEDASSQDTIEFKCNNCDKQFASPKSVKPRHEFLSKNLPS